MRFTLEQIEARLQAIVEGSAARIFPFGQNQADLSERLVNAMRANLHVQMDGTFWAPNLYTVSLHPTKAQAFAEDPAITNQLSRYLQQVGSIAGIKFPSSPELHVLPDPNLGLNESSIVSQYNLKQLTDTLSLEPEVENLHVEDAPQAFLIVDGKQIYPLRGGVVNIGRSSSNHLVIKDPRISRSHAQLRLINGRYVIFDLESTGGTYINQQRITQSPLYPGDVISLAGVPLIFGLEDNRRVDETQKFPPFSPTDLNPRRGRP